MKLCGENKKNGNKNIATNVVTANNKIMKFFIFRFSISKHSHNMNTAGATDSLQPMARTPKNESQKTFFTLFQLKKYGTQEIIINNSDMEYVFPILLKYM